MIPPHKGKLPRLGRHHYQGHAVHLIWMGLRRASDQLNAMKFLRTHLEPALGGGREWQHQPHDHVLREEERRRNAFASFCFYTLANPVRDELVKKESDWPYSGAIIPGYPSVHPLAEGFWELFWKLYVNEREACEPACVVREAHQFRHEIVEETADAGS